MAPGVQMVTKAAFRSALGKGLPQGDGREGTGKRQREEWEGQEIIADPIGEQANEERKRR